MNQKNGRTDPGPLRERARSLFISQATIDETLEWATPRQLAAIDRMLATELANREASKRARLMRQARFPVPKSLDGYDFANVRLPDGYTKEQPAGLDFAAKAQDLVFYGKTGRGKTHLATALGMLAVERGRHAGACAGARERFGRVQQTPGRDQCAYGRAGGRVEGRACGRHAPGA